MNFKKNPAGPLKVSEEADQLRAQDQRRRCVIGLYLSACMVPKQNTQNISQKSMGTQVEDYRLQFKIKQPCISCLDQNSLTCFTN